MISLFIYDLTAIQQFTVMIRITEVNGGTADFTEDLQNTTSLAFQTLAADVENTVRNNTFLNNFLTSNFDILLPLLRSVLQG